MYKMQNFALKCRIVKQLFVDSNDGGRCAKDNRILLAKKCMSVLFMEIPQQEVHLADSTNECIRKKCDQKL